MLNMTIICLCISSNKQFPKWFKQLTAGLTGTEYENDMDGSDSWETIEVYEDDGENSDSEDEETLFPMSPKCEKSQVGWVSYFTGRFLFGSNKVRNAGFGELIYFDPLMWRVIQVTKDYNF